MRIAGGIGDMWNAPGPSGGVTVTFEDGSERFLCFACVEVLPDDPDVSDVDDLDGSDVDDASGE